MRDPGYIFPPHNEVWSAERRHQDPAAFQLALRPIYEARGSLRCDCHPDGDLKLYIARRGDRFHVARWPETGDQHHPLCLFFDSLETLRTQSGDTVGVVEDSKDGYKRIKLHASLEAPSEKEKAESKKDEQDKDTDPDKKRGPTKRAITALGFLHLLWTEARLGKWYPAMKGRRGWAVVANELRRAANGLMAGRVVVGEALIVVGAKCGDEWRERVQTGNAPALERGLASSRSRVVVVGELEGLEKDDGSVTVRLKGIEDYGMRMVTSPEMAAHLVERHGTAVNACGKEGCRVIVMAIAEVRKDDNIVSFTMLAGGAMMTSSTFIPVESSYELALADQLTEEGRSFEKPLRYSAKEDVVFPDFMLLDTDPAPWPLEVYGMSDDPEYLARMEEKRDLYPQHYGVAGWEWDVKKDDLPTAFPPKSKSAAADRKT